MNHISAIIEPLQSSDWQAVSKIYAEGIATGMATFETEVPTWDVWDNKYIKPCRLVAVLNDRVVGFAVLSLVSQRKVYSGVAEVTLYVAKDHWGKGIGKKLLKELIKQSEAHGFWTLQASIFPENKASIELHTKCGFRTVGIKEKIGKLNGKWYDNHFMERRSKHIF